MSKKIIDFLKLLTDKEDMHKNNDSIDLSKYPSLSIEDIKEGEGTYEDWSCKTEELINLFFKIDCDRTYENAPFYQRV